MNERISNIFDYGDEIVVVEERDDQIDPARIKELTMDKIKYGGYRAMDTKAGRKARPAVRTLLIVAVVAVLLIGTAFAVYHFGFKDLVLTEKEDGSAVISVLGWRDTPEYLACAEWQAYRIEYNSTHEIPQTDDPNIPVYYFRVGAWSQEMVDTLDGILAKYDLKLHDSASIILPAEGSGIDVKSFFVGDTDAGGYAYRDGTMLLEGSHTFSDGETIDFQLFSAVKGTFTDVTANMDTVQEEWSYTAADGTEVSLIMGEYMSMLVADMDHAFVTAHTVFGNVSDRAALEEWADSICWKALNACRGFTDEYYSAYRAAQEEKVAAAEEAQAAREVIGGDWVLEEIVPEYRPESYGFVETDGAAWMEWTYTSFESEGTVIVRYERPAGDIKAAFEAMRTVFAAEERTLTDVPVYVRTETAEGAETVTEHRDFTVYIGTAANGSRRALWLDENKNLIFALTADPGELTEDEMISQIKYLLAGREPYSSQVEPEVVWARLGHYEPTWMPEGWYLNDEEMQFADVMVTDGVWNGYINQSYVTGELGQVIWFAYGTAPAGEDPYDILFESFGYTEEALNDPYFRFTRTTVNGRPAYLKELNDTTPSPVLVWLDEDAGVIFSLDSEASVDADTLHAIAESVALQ